MSGIEQLYDLDIDAAIKTFDSVCYVAPTDPRGYFFRSLVDYSLYTLTRDKQQIEAFLERSRKVISVCEDILDKDKNSAITRLFLGTTYFYRGLAYQVDGSILKAVTDGKKGLSNLEEAAREDSSLYDAQFGIGLSRCLMTRLPKSLSWVLGILGFKGDAEKGLHLLNLAADKGIYTRNEATLYLAQFLSQEQRFDEALKYLDRLLARYPNNTLFLTMICGIQYRQNKLEEALSSAKKVVQISSKRKQYGDRYIYGTLGNIYFGMDDFASAKENYELLLQKTQNKARISNYTYYRLAASAEIMGDHARAVAVCRSMEKVDQKERANDGYYYRRGQELIQSPMKEAGILLIKANNELGLKKYGIALELYWDALKKSSEDVDLRAASLYGVQQVYFQQEKYSEVVTFSGQLLGLVPSKERWLIPHGYFTLAQSYSKLGKISESIEAFKKIGDYEDYDFHENLEARVKSELEKLGKSG
jgi:tetratricopeptide (TPR) repeat protein